MAKTAIVVVVVLAIAASAALATYEYQKRQEYEIYSVVLNRLLSEHPAKVVVLWNQTSVDGHPVWEFDDIREAYRLNNSHTGSGGSESSSDISHVTGAAWADFKGRNARSVKVNLSKIRLPVPVITYDESEAPLSRRDPWGDFYRRYPGSWGWTMLSRVGFDRKAHQAVVLVSAACGGLCSGGYLFLVTESQGKWKVNGEYELWIS